MRCEDVQAHLPDRLTGTLPAPAADAIAAHLRTCAACAAEFGEIEDTWRQLDALPAPEADSSAMRARFTAALADYQQQANEPTAVRTRVLPYGLQFAAAAALVIVGVALGRGTAPAPTPAPDSQIAGLREELRDMREMVTLSLLQQQSASERLKGVSWTSRIERPGDDVTLALLDTLRYDPNDNVRLATVDALKRLAGSETVRRGALATLPDQTSPLVQIALIDFVVEMNDRGAAETLRVLSRDLMVDAAVRARAAAALAQVG